MGAQVFLEYNIDGVSFTFICAKVVCTFARFSRRPWVFSRALGCKGRRGFACTLRRKFGSRAGSVARVMGIQSREICNVTTRSLSEELDPSKTMKNPHISHFAIPTTMTSSTAVNALYFVAATEQQQSHIMFVWTTYMRVWTIHTSKYACL